MQRKILNPLQPEIALKGKNRHFCEQASPAILSRRLKIQARKSSAMDVLPRRGLEVETTRGNGKAAEGFRGPSP